MTYCTDKLWGKLWLLSSIWPWSSRSTGPKNNRDLNQCLLHIWSKFGDSSLNGWWVIARTSWWLADRHTHTHTHAGNDNTQSPKLASGKNNQSKESEASPTHITSLLEGITKCMFLICFHSNCFWHSNSDSNPIHYPLLKFNRINVHVTTDASCLCGANNVKISRKQVDCWHWKTLAL